MGIVWRLFGLLKKYWFWATVSMILLIATTLMALAVPDYIKTAIDTGVTAGDKKVLMTMGLLIIGVSVLRGILTFAQSYLSEYIGQKIAYDLRNRLYDRIQRLSFAFHDSAQTGQLMSRATQDVEAVRIFVAMGAVRSIYMLLTLVGIAGLLFFFNWQLALVTLAILPPVAFIALRMGVKQRPIWLHLQQELALMNIVMQEAFSGMRVVKAFNRQHSETVKFEREAFALYEDTIKTAKIQSFNGPLMGLFFSISAAAIIYVGGHQIISGQLTAGELAQFVLYSGMLAMPIRMLGFMVNIVARGISAGERIFEVLDTESAVKEKTDAIELTNAHGNVKFENVSFRYTSMNKNETPRYVLRNISFNAKPGEMVALLGATGSGKTTLVNLVPRFY
ncbi:MAG: ABC transporter transmembrane domain-containing protein, partial [Dehalococcoidales bacterium]|nr:ABC transporter transmembrane domain-containing protein [Dehalococcoidales bacterium]